MHGVEPVLFWVLDDASDTRQEPRHALADNHAHDDADVREGLRTVGSRRLHVYSLAVNRMTPKAIMATPSQL